MPVYNIVSSKRLISRIKRVYKPSFDGWIDDVIEAIGEGLSIIGYCAGYETVAKDITITNFKGVLPCNVDYIEAFSYNGNRLLPHDALIALDKCNLNNCNITNWYTLNPRFIQTSFESGIVTAMVTQLPVDDEGMPMIPDNTKCDIALSWYALKLLCLGGFTHPIVDYKLASQEWEKAYPQAQNDMNFPSVDGLNNFEQRWTSMVRNLNYTNEFFTGIDSPDMSTGLPVIMPKDNVQTIIHVTP